MKKVLIVSYFFPPLNNIASKRYGMMCKYFKKNGYDAYILTTTIKECAYFGSKRELDYPVEKKQILRIGKKNLYDIKKTNRILFFQYFCERYKLSFRTISIDDLLWYENVKETLNLKKLDNIDIVIGTYGPVGNLYIAKYIAKTLGRPYIVDIRDFISEWQEVEKGFRHCKKIDNIIERKLLSVADGIVAVTPRITKTIKKKYPEKKVITIFNGWDEIQTKPFCTVKEKYMYSAGSLYNHRIESLVVLLKALKRVNKEENIKLIIRSIGPKELDREAQRLISKMEMEDIAFILPSVTQDIIKEEQSRAYINFVLNSLDEDNLGEMGMLPGKTFEFMNEDAPILAISPQKSDLAKILSYTNKGFATISEKEIVDFILHTHKDYVGNDNILKFTREFQAMRLCRFMDYVLQ